MKCTVLLGSPRYQGNTQALLPAFIGALEARAQVESFWLNDLNIAGCQACRGCQQDFTGAACVLQDDMERVFESVLGCDMMILATPIYSFYCPAPMKAALDRMMYGFNKYYGDTKGPSIWAGKKVALFLTAGFPKTTDLFVEGMQRYCRHSQLEYVDMYVAKDPGYHKTFLTDEKLEEARAYGEKLLAAMG